ncbi:DUF3157 family protein [Leptospira sp. FAT2]|uniref:DUF3157 family protein n=1 Tax=Leptospira sanjuanensis TaxID=2879643 RepID=UPI001EE88D74|nr:DUF3157 family protein [Leptospira sanjuanensis]MCG6168090.1 DUF3157 family protein [Leptospira sanjuanensis]MCG6193507.1 DUF3157 family protein [Leptospira sanjuanensis]
MKQIVFLLFIILATEGFATEEATTKSGKKVILNSDFTWKYVNETAEKNKSNEKAKGLNLTKSEEQSAELKSESGEFEKLLSGLILP